MSGTIEVSSRTPALIDVVIGGAPVTVNTGGSGLPPQWSQGANGDVTATVDDPTKTALTIAAMTAQTADLWEVLDEDGDPLWQMEPGGHVIHRAHAWPTFSNVPAYKVITEELAADGIDIFEVYSEDQGFPLFALDSSGGIECQQASFNSIFFVKNTGFNRAEYQFGTDLNQTQIQQKLHLTTVPGQTYSMLEAYNGDTAVYVFRVRIDGTVVSNGQTLPDVADLQVGDHGSISDPVASTVTHFLKDSGGVLRTNTMTLT